MSITKQTRQAFSASVGAVDWLAERTRQAWEQRDQWGRWADDAYTELVERGEAWLNEGEREARRQGRSVGRAARRVPGVPSLEGEARGVVADPGQLPLADYDSLNVDQVTRQLPSLSQRELHQVEGYEAVNQARATVLRRIDELRGQEPWPTYDEMTVDDIVARLRELPTRERTSVADYEQHHKNRRTVLEAAGRQ